MIKVGAATESEMKEKKARVEDAMHATKAAVEEGIVPGGGVALIRCIPGLDDTDQEGEERGHGRRHPDREARRWRSRSARSRTTPVTRARSSSIRSKELEKDKGFDAQTEKFVNMHEAGIIDPTKVVRSALQNAASIASLMLTTEAVINEIPEEKKAAGGARPAWRRRHGRRLLIDADR